MHELEVGRCRIQCYVHLTTQKRPERQLYSSIIQSCDWQSLENHFAISKLSFLYTPTHSTTNLQLRDQVPTTIASKYTPTYTKFTITKPMTIINQLNQQTSSYSDMQTKLEQKCVPVLREFHTCTPTFTCASMCIR